MTDQQLIIAVAKLDGCHAKQESDMKTWAIFNSRNERISAFWTKQKEEYAWQEFSECDAHYLTSHDAIIPVIERHRGYHGRIIWALCIANENVNEKEPWSIEDCITVLTATPKQLSIALVKATGNWEE